MRSTSEILENLPYAHPFRFVDELIHVDENGAKGSFTFHDGLDFYNGHFVGNPVTPGAILTECMAQIGLVCLGLYLIEDIGPEMKIGLTSTEIEFLKPVLPNRTVTVVSTKKYFRFGKLKCEVTLYDQNGEVACAGTIAGMITN